MLSKIQSKRSDIAMILAFASTSIANYGFSLVMARLLLPGDFGVLAFAQTLLLFSGLILETGVPWSLAREVATAPNANARASSIRGATITNVSIALLLSASIVLLYALGPLQVGLENWKVVGAVALALPLIAFVGVARGATQGLEAFSVLATLQTTEVVSKAVASTFLVSLGLATFGAVAGFVIGAALAALFGLAALARQTKMSIVGPAKRSGPQIIGPMFGAFLGSALLLNLDFIALKLLANEERAEAGFYQAGIVLANAPYFLVSSVIIPLIFAKLAQQNNLASTANVIAQALKRTAIFVVPIELVLIAAPSFILTLLFPASYQAGADALRFRAIGVALFVLATVLASAYQAVGRASRVAIIFLGASVIELFLLIYLVRFSAEGTAIAFTVTMLVVTATLGLSYLSQLTNDAYKKLPSWLFRYIIVLSTSSLAFWLASKVGVGMLSALMISGGVYIFLTFILRLLPMDISKKHAPLGTLPVTRA